MDEARPPRPQGRRSKFSAQSRRSSTPRTLPIAELVANPLNPRDDHDSDLELLTETVRLLGQLQPVLIVPRETYLDAHPEQVEALGKEAKWVVIAGNRRLAAVKAAGLETVLVQASSSLDTSGKLDRAIVIENTQRKPISPLHEAAILKNILSEDGRSLREVAKEIGMSHAYVQQRVDLLRLIPEFKVLLGNETLNVKTARRIAIQSDDVQRRIFAAGPPYRVKQHVPGPSETLGVSSPDAEGGEVEIGATGGSAVNPVSTGQSDDLDVADLLSSALDELAELQFADEHVEKARQLVESALATLKTRRSAAIPGRWSS